MLDSGISATIIRPAVPARRRALVPPLLRRILLVNAMPLVLLLAALLYLDQYQTGLLEAEVTTLREIARIYAGALGQSAVREEEGKPPVLQPDLAGPLLRNLTDPTPNAQAKFPVRSTRKPVSKGPMIPARLPKKFCIPIHCPAALGPARVCATVQNIGVPKQKNKSVASKQMIASTGVATMATKRQAAVPMDDAMMNDLRANVGDRPVSTK